MLPIAGQTAKPIGLNFFVDTQVISDRTLNYLLPVQILNPLFRNRHEDLNRYGR